MKVVYPVCCGDDVRKSFFIATIITITPDIQPNYSCKRFLTFNNGVIRFADWLASNNCNDVCMESTGKYWISVFNILESGNINTKQAVKFLEKRGYLVSCNLIFSLQKILLQGLFAMGFFLFLLFLILSR